MAEFFSGRVLKFFGEKKKKKTLGHKGKSKAALQTVLQDKMEDSPGYIREVWTRVELKGDGRRGKRVLTKSCHFTMRPHSPNSSHKVTKARLTSVYATQPVNVFTFLLIKLLKQMTGRAAGTADFNREVK